MMWCQNNLYGQDRNGKSMAYLRNSVAMADRENKILSGASLFSSGDTSMPDDCTFCVLRKKFNSVSYVLSVSDKPLILYHTFLSV